MERMHNPLKRQIKRHMGKLDAIPEMWETLINAVNEDTYRIVLKINPKQKAIIVSGFSETDRVNQAQALGAGAYVRKPYLMERLGLAVRKELDRSTKTRQK